jgi:hypothetical protein
LTYGALLKNEGINSLIYAIADVGVLIFEVYVITRFKLYAIQTFYQAGPRCELVAGVVLLFVGSVIAKRLTWEAIGRNIRFFVVQFMIVCLINALYQSRNLFEGELTVKYTIAILGGTLEHVVFFAFYFVIGLRDMLAENAVEFLAWIKIVLAKLKEIS